MGKPAARITDMHTCPMVTGIVPHVGGPIALGSFNVFTGKLAQARVGDMAVCVGPPDVIALGSTGVFVNKMAAARMGDLTAHGGVIALGLPTVLIGEVGGGGGGGAPGPMGIGMASHGFTGGGVPNLSFADAAAMRQAMEQAARNGTPFCEVCWKAAHGNGISSAGAPQVSGATEFKLSNTTPALATRHFVPPVRVDGQVLYGSYNKTPYAVRIRPSGKTGPVDLVQPAIGYFLGGGWAFGMVETSQQKVTSDTFSRYIKMKETGTLSVEYENKYNSIIGHVDIVVGRDIPLFHNLLRLDQFAVMHDRGLRENEERFFADPYQKAYSDDSVNRMLISWAKEPLDRVNFNEKSGRGTKADDELYNEFKSYKDLWLVKLLGSGAPAAGIGAISRENLLDQFR